MKVLVILCLILSLTSVASASNCSYNTVFLKGDVDRSFKKLMRKKGFKRVKSLAQAKYEAKKVCNEKYYSCYEENQMREICLENSRGRIDYDEIEGGGVNRCDRYRCTPGYYIDSCSVTLTNLETMKSKTFTASKNFFGIISWKKYKMPVCKKLGL